MKEILVKTDDHKKIYTRFYKTKNDNRALLFLHGGPGSSCITFQHMATQLLEYINVILIDQRGVLRSDKLESNNECTIDMLVDDCETIRKFFNINKLILLGHSFGGFISLLYASKYPNLVEKVIFENPTFSFKDSMQSLQAKALNYLKKENKFKLINKLNIEITDIQTTKSFISTLLEMPEEIKTKIYNTKPFDEYSEEQKENLNAKVDIEERWQYCITHFQKVMEDKNAYNNLIGLIPKLNCETLLLCGEFDPILSNNFKEYYKRNSLKGNLVIIKNCGHFIHTDSPDEYLKNIIKFIKK